MMAMSYSSLKSQDTFLPIEYVLSKRFLAEIDSDVTGRTDLMKS